MKYINKGSSILVFIIVLSGLITVTTVVWRTIAYSVDNVIERQTQYQVYYLVQGIHQWCVQFVIDNYQELRKHIKKESPILLDMNQWPLYIDAFKKFNCTCLIEYKNRTSICVLTSFEKGMYKCGISCIISAVNFSNNEMSNEKKEFEITHYKIIV